MRETTKDSTHKSCNSSRRRVKYLADELNITSLDVSDAHNSLLGEEMEGQVIDRIPEDTLLDEDDVGATLDDLLDETDDVFLLLLEDLVDLGVVSDHDVAVHIGLGGGQAELEEGDLGVLDLGRASVVTADLIIGEDDSVDHLDVVDGSTDLLADLDVVEVHIVIDVGVADLHHGVNGNGGQELGVLGHHLAAESSLDALDELVLVGEVYGGGHIVQDFKTSLESDGEAVRNGGGVDSLGHESGAGGQKSTGDDHNTGGSVSGLDVLGNGGLDELGKKAAYDFGDGVEDRQVLEDGGSVVGDEDFPLAVLDHLVHTSGSQTGSENIGDSWGQKSFLKAVSRQPDLPLAAIMF